MVHSGKADHVGTASVSLHLFGGFHPGGGLNTRQQALLAYLVLRHPRPASRAEAAFTLWPESSEEQALTNLRKALHHIKGNYPHGEIIQSDARTLQLNPDLDLQLDVAGFASALDSAERARRADNPLAEQTALETASAIYRGDLLPGLYDDWLVPERERLRGLFLRAMDRLIALLETRQHYRDAIRHAQRLSHADNLREETYRALIRLHALNNDRAAALNVYHTCAGILAQELGVEPDASTRELYERLLKSDIQVLRVSAPARPMSHPLVGREREWKFLLAEWRRAEAGGLRTVVLSGEAGIGKTRLAEDLSHWTARQGIRTVMAGCYAAEGQVSFAPLTGWLRAMPLDGVEARWRNELARILPELHDGAAAPQPMTEKWQRQVFFEAMARALLAGSGPLLLLLDDIQWCDNDTLEWLRFFLRFDKGARLLLLATLRAEELPSNPQLQLLLLDLRSEGQLAEIELVRLNEAQTAELGTHLLGGNFSEAEAGTLFRESEGVPLFVVELANAGLRVDPAHGAGSGAGAVEAQGLPPRLKAVLEGRLARLSAPARAVVESAAVVGREFDLGLLRAVSEHDEGTTVYALDELWRTRMVRERGGLYDFSHDKLRESTLAGISPVRLRWLHQRAGEALESLQNEHEYARVADHFDRAGLYGRASAYYQRAAAHARKLFAFGEALEHLRHAILLETRHEALADLHEQRGDLLMMLERREEAFRAFEQALNLSADGLQRARVNRRQASLSGRFETEVARQKYLATLEELERARHAPGYWSEWIKAQLTWVEVCYWMQDSAGMEAVMDRIREPIERHGSLLQRIQYRFRLISGAFIRERYRLDSSHVALAQETLDLAIESDNPNYLMNARRQFGMVAMCAGQLDVSVAAYREVIALCKKNSDWNALLIARTYLSLSHRRLHRPDEVRADTELLEQDLRQVTDNPSYRGIVAANRAWLAWLAGETSQARDFARAAVEIWASLTNPYPVQWTALTVLFAIAVQAENADEALIHARALLDVRQWRLTPEVEAALLAALEPAASAPHLFLSHCRVALEKAKEAGYL